MTLTHRVPRPRVYGIVQGKTVCKVCGAAPGTAHIAHGQKAPQKKKRKSPNATAKADVLFSRIVRARDQGRCVHCGSDDRVQAAHVWSRRYRSLRWKLENCVTLAQGCHFYWTTHPAEFAVWCETQRFCEMGLCIDHEPHEFDSYTYAQLRNRALNDSPERAVDALDRLKVL